MSELEDAVLALEDANYYSDTWWSDKRKTITLKPGMLIWMQLRDVAALEISRFRLPDGRVWYDAAYTTFNERAVVERIVNGKTVTRRGLYPETIVIVELNESAIAALNSFQEFRFEVKWGS